MISVLILTRNEELDLPGCLASVAWSDDVHVLDSFRPTKRQRSLAQPERTSTSETSTTTRLTAMPLCR